MAFNFDAWSAAMNQVSTELAVIAAVLDAQLPVLRSQRVRAGKPQLAGVQRAASEGKILAVKVEDCREKWRKAYAGLNAAAAAGAGGAAEGREYAQ